MLISREAYKYEMTKTKLLYHVQRIYPDVEEFIVGKSYKTKSNQNDFYKAIISSIEKGSTILEEKGGIAGINANVNETIPQAAMRLKVESQNNLQKHLEVTQFYASDKANALMVLSLIHI